MRHPVRWILAAAVVVFLVISGLLARWLAVENVERSAVLVVLEAQARGDARAMLAHLQGCDRHCRADVEADARRLARPGQVEILAYHSGTAYALSSSTAYTRVAWKSSLRRFPIVQCVKVARRGNALSGITVELLTISVPIPDTADC